MGERKSRPGQRVGGFGLIELLVAMFILTFGLLAVAQLLPLASRLDALARGQSTAALLAQSELDRLAGLYSRNPAAAELTAGPHRAETLRELKNPQTGAVLERYRVEWVIESLADPRPGVTLPGVTVSLRLTPMRTESEELVGSGWHGVVMVNAVLGLEP